MLSHASVVFYAERGAPKTKVIDILSNHSCWCAFGKIVFVFGGSINHFVPNNKVCWSARGNCKCICKARTNSNTDHIFSLTRRGLGEVELVKLVTQFAGHVLDSVFPV